MIASSAGLRSLRCLLLLAALFFGQTAMLAHAAEHLDAQPASEICLVCLAGKNFDGSAPPPAALPLVDASLQACALPALPAFSPEYFSFRRQARGPPAT